MWPMAYDASFADDEQVVLRLRPHWKTLVRPVLVAVIVVIAALIVEVIIPSGKYSGIGRLAVGVVAILALMLWLIGPLLQIGRAHV